MEMLRLMVKTSIQLLDAYCMQCSCSACSGHGMHAVHVVYVVHDYEIDEIR